MRVSALSFYLLASQVLAPIAWPLLKLREAKGKEDPLRLRERLGHPGLPRPPGRVIWIHAASVGEAMSALPLIDALREKVHASVLLTSGTVTSAQRVAAMLPDGVVHQFVPIDTAPAVRRFLDHWRPDLAIWIESEMWPRLIMETARREVPMALVNARLSARSLQRWARAPKMIDSLLGAFRLLLTQDEQTMDRLAEIGHIAQFAGNLKSLVAPLAVDEAELERLRNSIDGVPVWLAASTHAGEEAPALEAHLRLEPVHGFPLLIIAPRHPERGDAVAHLLESRGVNYVRRSRAELPGPGTQVLLADTLGEMGLWYRLAPVTFVGGSLVAKGGHTPFEPVQLHSAVVHGPHVDNFAPAYAALAHKDAVIRVTSPKTLAIAVETLFGDELARRRLATRALEVHELLQPDIGRMVEQLTALMEGSP